LAAGSADSVGCVVVADESVAAVLSGVSAGAALSPEGAAAAGGATASSARAANQDTGAARQQATVKLAKTRFNRIMLLDSKNGKKQK
jgi:hypothetical protein